MNTKKTKKIPALFLILILALTLPAIVSCADGDNASGGNQNNEAENNQNGNQENNGGISEADIKPPRDMPERDFDGYNFTFLVKEFDGNGYWGAIDIFSEAETGEPVNDAVFRRNRTVEDRYNIEISEVRDWDLAGRARRVILADSHDYDVIMPNLNNIAGLATQGLLLDAKADLPYLQLDQVWWDQRANSMLSMNNCLYFLIGDMTLMANDATWVIMFNKNVVEEYAFGNLYDYVKEDNWTFDTFFGYVKQVSRDLDGNGIFDENDQLGLLTDSGARTILIYNTGEMVARKNENDLPFLSLNTERAQNAAQRVFEIISDRTISINAHTDLSHISDPWTNGINRMFQENKGLFYMISLTVMHHMRAMHSDFGILPSPKLDSSQAEYYHTVQPSTTNCMVLPVTTPDPEMASIIIEEMNYEARDTVRRAYFDITITNKTIRDEESAEMLDLIFSTRIYDLGFIFNWGNMGYLLETVYPDAGRFVSRFEAAEARAQTAMEATIEEVLQ
jgi:hypothetical protein